MLVHQTHNTSDLRELVLQASKTMEILLSSTGLGNVKFLATSRKQNAVVH
jgi:hypothetical protein